MYDEQMGDTSEWRKLRKRLVEQGCRIEGGGDRHFKVFRGKELLTSMPTSCGGGRGLRNQKAQLRKRGLQV